MKIKLLLVTFALFILTACGGGSSGSGGGDETTEPGTGIPTEFLGEYNGTISVTVSALGISESESFPIKVTVTSDGMVTFEIDGDTESIGISNAGNFSEGVNLADFVEECTGTATLSGSVDGVTASGTLSASGDCTYEGVNFDATVDATFNATKS